MRAKSKVLNDSEIFYFIISDMPKSEMYEKVVERLSRKYLNFEVVLIQNGETSFSRSLNSVNVKFSTIQPRGSFRRLSAIFLLIKKFKIDRPGIVIMSGQAASFVGTIANTFFHPRIRIVARHHALTHHKMRMIHWWISDILINYFSSHVIAVSESHKEMLMTKELVPSSKIQVIHNGIDISKFQSVTHQARIHGNDGLRVGVIARLTYFKGVKYALLGFLKFFEENRNATLTIIGEKADAYIEIDQLIPEFARRSIFFKDSVDDIPKFLANLDVFVHVPIGKWEESFGLVYIESLLSSTRKIFTLSGVLNEIENIDRYTHIVPYGNSDRICEALAFESSYLEPMPLTILEKFSMEVCILNYETFLEGAIS
jgi:glycosyltransferase involved in cell wall biosynthesis